MKVPRQGGIRSLPHEAGVLGQLVWKRRLLAAGVFLSVFVLGAFLCLVPGGRAGGFDRPMWRGSWTLPLHPSLGPLIDRGSINPAHRPFFLLCDVRAPGDFAQGQDFMVVNYGSEYIKEASCLYFWVDSPDLELLRGYMGWLKPKLFYLVNGYLSLMFSGEQALRTMELGTPDGHDASWYMDMLHTKKALVNEASMGLELQSRRPWMESWQLWLGLVLVSLYCAVMFVYLQGQMAPGSQPTAKVVE